MYTIANTSPMKIVGLRMRTTNERAFQDIPEHWQSFFSEGAQARIPEAVSDAVYAVYTDFEHQGRDNDGTYSFIIGAQVPDALPAPDGMVEVHIPASLRAVFTVETGHPERVGDAWRTIWSTSDLHKTFVCDYERYEKEGAIGIFVGVR